MFCSEMPRSRRLAPRPASAFFLLLALTAVLTAASFAQTASRPQAAPQPWPPEASQFRLHMIGNAHIDPVWLWPWHEGVSAIHSTFRSALDRLNEDPQIAMTTSSSQFYEWVAANDPALLAEIRKRVEEGLWDLVGGWWVEPDVNIPNGESLVRQGLYGQLTLRRLFGRTARVGYNPDSFGHPGSLPQILKLEGMEDYVFERPGVAEKTLPGNLFWWQGIDGSRVLTYRIPVSYDDRTGSLEPRTRKIVELFTPQPLRDAMQFYGVGDHGGGPTRANMASIQAIQKQPGAPTLLYSTPDNYFAEVRKSRQNFPVLADDLQHHSVGCYTAESAIKKNNREAEAALATAEKLSAVGSFAWGASYPHSDFTESWKRVLFLQFHDSLAGTSLPEHYKTARQGLGRALDVAEQASFLAAQKLAWQVPTTDPASNYLVVFNPHAWPTLQTVEYDLGVDAETTFAVEDEAGHALPFQWVQPTVAAQGRHRLAVQLPLPAFGYRQVRIHPIADAASAQPTPLRTTASSMENEHLRVSFSPDGSLGIFDKDANREVFRGGQTGARAVVLDDDNDTWAHNVVSYTKELGSFRADSVKLVESGPLRALLRVHSTYGASSLTTDWILTYGARTLEARVTLDWHEHLKLLKFSFPVDLETPRATYEIAYGAMERATKGEEDPGQRWIDVTAADNSYGLTVLNDAKYGYSVQASDMRISIARGTVYANHMPQKIDESVRNYWEDQGEQTFRLVLAPHAGFWQSIHPAQLAEQLVAPPLVVYQGIHPGARPQSDSFLSVDAPNIVVSAAKLPEEGSGLIVRMVETEGKQTSASIRLPFAKLHWQGSFHPFEIKTLRLDPKTGNIAAVNLLEE
ncbi:MAG: glycoside hydrolase family 38 C-terminal domain-containing protein [Terracidiphilus sp.]|nr:glycoside hydrolase family 38 C-terminal domain-containing protein [Terracidiphilus sp.]